MLAEVLRKRIVSLQCYPSRSTTLSCGAVVLCYTVAYCLIIVTDAALAVVGWPLSLRVQDDCTLPIRHPAIALWPGWLEVPPVTVQPEQRWVIARRWEYAFGV